MSPTSLSTWRRRGGGGSCVAGKNAQPVAIGRLEVFVADYQRQQSGLPMPELPPSTGKRVAVGGAGPAGLADGLFERGFHAVFLGHGATKETDLDIPGEAMNGGYVVPGKDLKGVYWAMDFLVRSNVPPERLPRQ